MAEHAIGIHCVDVQHQQLVDEIGTLLGAVQDGRREKLMAHLETLQTLVLEHFATEERLMTETRYAELDSHRARHETFISTFLRLKDQLATDARPKTELQPLLERQIGGWLRAHIASCDVPMGAHLRRNGIA